MKPGILWIGIVVGFLLLSVFIQGALVVASLSDPSFAVEPDYERRAADWDSEKQLERRSRELGWLIDLSTAPGTEAGTVRVTVDAFDAHGKPLREATVEIEAFHLARARDVVRATLPRIGDGRYEAVLEMPRSGRWEFHLRVLRADDLFVRTLRRSVLSVPRFDGGSA